MQHAVNNSNIHPIFWQEDFLRIQKHQRNAQKSHCKLLITAQKNSFPWIRMEIHDFQEMMKQLYFKRDSARGVNGTYNWLVDEVTELGEELKGIDREATEKEFADVIAWLASLANIMGIDLEKAALHKYPHKCPKCQASPCQCTF